MEQMHKATCHRPHTHQAAHEEQCLIVLTTAVLVSAVMHSGPAAAAQAQANMSVVGAPADHIVAAATKARDPAKFEAVKTSLTAEEEALRKQLAELEDSEDEDD